MQAAFVAFPLKYTVTHLRGIIKVLLGVIPCLAYVTMDLKDSNVGLSETWINRTVNVKCDFSVREEIIFRIVIEIFLTCF